PERTAVATNGVGDAHGGRAVSMQRRRQLSQGKQALNGAAAPPAASNGQGPSNGTLRAPERTAVATNGVGDAHGGRAVSMERRRQLSQGKQALSAGGERTAAAAGAGTGAPAPDPENLNVDVARSGREQARARRAEASRLGRAGISRPKREGRVRHVPKVIVSPTHGDQRVTWLRIGQGERVTGDEPGAALPVTGTQYVGADGPPPAWGAGTKVGRVRTPKGLVVSGTTVRNKVAITGDEAGEHLRITGEADQKFDDDLTPRRDGTIRPAQFPRRADPQGATAVGTTLGVQPRVAEPWLPLENTNLGLAVTGTAVGSSGRVTGNEAGACRPITGDQYQQPSFYASECGGIGGGTAPAAHLNRGRLDPVTAGKVSMAQTWQGQRVTGPSLEYRSNVTGHEPGACRPVTGTPYQGPSTLFGWCEPEEGEPATQRLESRPEGVAVTGDLPLYAENVTGTERGYRNDITGSSYYGDMRPAEPAGDDAATWQCFSVPVALARRLAGRQSGDARREAEDAAPASCTPGSITGSFAVGDGMVTGNNEFLFRPRLNREAKQLVAVTGEGETKGRTITGSLAAWTRHDLVTGTDGYIAAGRNPSEGGGGTNGWAGSRRFKNLATPGAPSESARVTGRVGGSPKDAASVTVSGGARG
ncbi:MAG: CsoS2 family carboxysome shell protein, partial [Acidimicrobiales bacterium]